VSASAARISTRPRFGATVARDMPEYGKVRSRGRETGKGPRVYWFIDWSPELRGPDRYLRGFRGKPFRDEADAERTRERVCQDATRLPLAEAVELYRRPQAQKSLVTRLAAEWLAAVQVEPSSKTGRPISPYTLIGYRAVVENHMAFWKGAQVREVTAPSLRQWVTWMRAKGIEAKTIRNALVPLRGVVRRYREENPDMPEPVWPTIATPKKKRKPMTLADILRALEHMPEERLGLYLAMMYTSCRPGEARALRMQDYDFGTGTLTIEVAAKTRSGANPKVGDTKNTERGSYALPDDLRAWVLKWRGDARLDRTAPLFPNPETGNMWGHGAVLKWWRRACESAQVEYTGPYFATKHSPGTALLEAGLSREDLQAAFRHRAANTQMFYDVEDDARRARATSKLAELVEQAKPAGPPPGPSRAPSPKGENES